MKCMGKQKPVGTQKRPSLQLHFDMGVLDIVPAGVVSGKDVYKVFDYAREHSFAIPAFNVTVCSAAFESDAELVGCQCRSRGCA